MADRPEDRDDDRPLTPAEEERVRRLLADARHTEPIPGDVAARLDAVLAGLAAERADPSAADAAVASSSPAAGPGGAPVADLDAARRRRRRWTQVLVAAAAVTVVGLAGPQLLNGAGDMMTASESADSGADSGAGGADDTAGGVAPEAAEQDGSAAGAAESGEARSSAAAAPELTRDSLTSQARRLRTTSPAPEAALQGDQERSALLTDLQACRDGADWGAGRRVLVTYEGAAAVLVYRAPADGSQLVDLFLCGESTPTRTLTLPAP